ncbi:MAG TPA: SCO family protein [Gallionella sp.]|nr:SCO family protein [Gallionella sp.]
MKYYELLLVVATLTVGTGVVHRDSMAMTAGEEHHHHHHVMAMAGAGYKRTVVEYKVPDIKLQDMNGQPVALREMLDGSNPVMMNFIFTTCTTICPVTSATFAMVQEKLGSAHEKPRLVSISIDPEQDTPERLKAYAQKFGAGPHWSMLTGSAANSIAVQRAFDVYRGDKMNHQPVTFIRKGAGQPWVRIEGFATADDLLREYQKITAN